MPWKQYFVDYRCFDISIFQYTNDNNKKNIRLSSINNYSTAKQRYEIMINLIETLIL